MTKENKEILQNLLKQHNKLGISEQIDYEKFYLYSLITHSTAIEGSTVTELEAQLLFDEGITSNKRTITEQMMNIDLKSAYEYGREWIKRHEHITVDWLIGLAAKVMSHTGSDYHSMGGDFSSAKGELRKLNVTAGIGGRSYMSYLKVPSKLESFCTELNRRRKNIDKSDVTSVYDMSFWAHYELVTIHPWADGNGRTSRLLMNLLQMEFDLLPTKILKEDKAEYIQALIDTREKKDIDIFQNYMASLHQRHLQTDIDQFLHSTCDKMVDKTVFVQKMVDKFSIKPVLAKKMADILCIMDENEYIKTETIVHELGLTPTTAKRYLRKLTEFGLLESFGGNKNRKYRRNMKNEIRNQE